MTPSSSRGIVPQLAAAAARIPSVVFFTALGSGVIAARALLHPLGTLFGSGSEEPSRQHHQGRVRERAIAAEQAARAAGLLSRRDP